MAKAQQSSGLETVQSLYLMQIQLSDFLQKGIRSEKQKKEAAQCLREFRNLLKQADPDYMGGEEVLETLHTIQDEMAVRLKARSRRSRAKSTAKTRRKK